ncbi:hypothetical protein BKD09_45465 [Bradyrhizobium japonicum]|uniref:HNH nuclease domain-containing protein n=1 Tax=Bradyrhizobium japonicum TaxID=375 RepID=A0A1L3FQD3_BRAJP|nr:hypothetical protein BKD09_45465 [Bradyrhizobium japonicum]
MIRVQRGPSPRELTATKIQELTAEYLADTSKAVWNKPYIRKSLLAMSRNKCVYCETRIDEESKYMEVDHYYCKDQHPTKVVEWINLLPACKRCNVNKGSYDIATEGELVDPTQDDPQQHLILVNYRLRGRDDKGRRVVEHTYLNETNRTVKARFEIGASVSEAIERLSTLVEECLPTPSDRRKLSQLERGMLALLEEARPTSEYSATVATILAGIPEYRIVKDGLKTLGRWSPDMASLESQMLQCNLG